MTRLWFWSGLMAASAAGFIWRGGRGSAVFVLSYIALNALAYSLENPNA